MIQHITGRMSGATFSCIPLPALPCVPHCPHVHPGLCTPSWALQPGLVRHRAAFSAAAAPATPPHPGHPERLLAIFQRFLSLRPFLLNYPHSNVMFLKVWAAEDSHHEHKGECLKWRFPKPALDRLHCSLNRSRENALNSHLPASTWF